MNGRDAWWNATGYVDDLVSEFVDVHCSCVGRRKDHPNTVRQSLEKQLSDKVLGVRGGAELFSQQLLHATE